jgi:hypothetical protein
MCLCTCVFAWASDCEEGWESTCTSSINFWIQSIRTVHMKSEENYLLSMKTIILDCTDFQNCHSSFFLYCFICILSTIALFILNHPALDLTAGLPSLYLIFNSPTACDVMSWDTFYMLLFWSSGSCYLVNQYVVISLEIQTAPMFHPADGENAFLQNNANYLSVVNQNTLWIFTALNTLRSLHPSMWSSHHFCFTLFCICGCAEVSQ